MTRKDQMLDEFDGLAAAELDDIATLAGDRPARAAAIRPAVQLPPATTKFNAWDWPIGVGAISLVFLAARK